MPAAKQGNLTTADGSPLPLKGTTVEMRIDGPVADVLVEQRFVNTLPSMIEATYTFPLPHNSAVYAFHFMLGARVVRGVIKEKAEAKKSYEAAKAAGKVASLLDSEKDNLFTMSVANVDPGVEILVSLSYQERLKYDAGEYTIMFPMVAADAHDDSRVGGGGLGGGAAKAHAGGGQAATTVVAFIQAGMDCQAPQCLTYDVVTEARGLNSFVVRLVDGQAPDRDFVLTYRVGAAEIQPAIFFERAADSASGAFLFTLVPPPTVDASVRPALDVCFLLDRSFSMRGGALKKATTAVLQMLDELKPTDAIQFYAVDHDLTSFDPQVPNAWVPLAAPRDPRAMAEAFVDAMVPCGGSNIEAALLKAGELPVRAGRSKVICLITDAAVGHEERLYDLAKRAVGNEVPTYKALPAELQPRLFVLGCGPAVNRQIVEKLAQFGGGSSEVIMPRQVDISGTVARFAARMIGGGPVLKDLELEWAGAQIELLHPARLPVLFAGQPLLLVGRYRGVGESQLRVRGRRAGLDEPFYMERAIALPAVCADYKGIDRLWARQRLDHFKDTKVGFNAFDAEIRSQALALSLRYGLMSEYTSFVAVDETDAPLRITVASASSSATAQLNTLKATDSVRSLRLAAAALVGAHAGCTLLHVAGMNAPIDEGRDATTLGELGLSGTVTVTVSEQEDARAGIVARIAEYERAVRLNIEAKAAEETAAPRTLTASQQSELDAAAAAYDNAVAQHEERYRAAMAQQQQRQQQQRQAVPTNAAEAPAPKTKRGGILSAVTSTASAVTGHATSIIGGLFGRKKSKAACAEAPADDCDATLESGGLASAAPSASISSGPVAAPVRSSGPIGGPVPTSSAASPVARPAAASKEMPAPRPVSLGASSSSAPAPPPPSSPSLSMAPMMSSMAPPPPPPEPCLAPPAPPPAAPSPYGAMAPPPPPPAAGDRPMPPPPPGGGMAPCPPPSGRSMAPMAPPKRAPPPGGGGDGGGGGGGGASDGADSMKRRRSASPPMLMDELRCSSLSSRCMEAECEADEEERWDDCEPEADAPMPQSFGGLGTPMVLNPSTAPRLLKMPAPVPVIDGQVLLNAAAERVALMGNATSSISGLQAPDAYPQAVLDYCRGKPIGDLDLAFVIDETGSMGSWIGQVQAKLRDIIAAVSSSPLCTSLRIGVVGYRDHPPQDHTFASRALDLTPDMDLVGRAVSSLQASGGGDGPETLTDGMYDLVRLSWRPTAARCAIIVTDAPPHGCGDGGDGFPQGCPCGQSWYREAENLREMGVATFTVGCGVSGVTKLVLETIAMVTFGLYVPLSDVAVLIPIITGAAESQIDRQRIEEHLLDVINADAAALAEIEMEADLVDTLFARMQAQQIQPRQLVLAGSSNGMKVRPLNREDVVAALEVLRSRQRVNL